MISTCQFTTLLKCKIQSLSSFLRMKISLKEQNDKYTNVYILAYVPLIKYYTLRVVTIIYICIIDILKYKVYNLLGNTNNKSPTHKLQKYF